MKITHNKVGQNLNINDSKESSKSAKAGAAGKSGAAAAPEAALANLGKTDNQSSKVNLSERARDIKKAKEIATATPDVDEAKVARLQKMIDEGKYKVEAKDIADKMVDEELAWS